jgi:hypothetical protein
MTHEKELRGAQPLALLALQSSYGDRPDLPFSLPLWYAGNVIILWQPAIDGEAGQMILA